MGLNTISKFIIKKQFVLIVCCLLALSKNVFAVDPGLDWKTIESTHLYVHYADGNKAIAERALVIAEAAHKRLTKELNWEPIEKTHIVISDETDQPNGYATPVYFNHTVLFVAPPTSINTLEDFDDWFTTLIVHEYFHIVHLDKSAGSPEYLRSIFGRFLFLFPNIFQPSWIHEGLATYNETDLDRGIGRGQSTMFASMMREEVANGVQPISHVNLPVKTWPAGTTRYLYGVYFMAFLAEKYGEDRMYSWIEEYSDNLLPFFINTNANKTLGENLTPLWGEFQQWLKNRFQPQIESIKSKALKSAEQFSVAAYKTDSVRTISGDDGEEVYYVSSSGYKRATLMFVDADGKHQELLDLNGSAGIDVHHEAGVLLTQNEYCNNYTIYSDIYLYDKNSDDLKRLTECGRYLFASWLPDGQQMIAVHHDSAHFELQRLDADAKLLDVLWRANDGDIIAQIDVSDDANYVVASIWRKGEGWNIELFEISTGHWKKITTGVSIAAYPRFAPDGNILFSLEGVFAYNLHRYDIKTGKLVRLTDLTGGAFQSSQADIDGPVYYAGYSAEGYAIYKLEMDKLGLDKLEADDFEPARSEPDGVMDISAATKFNKDRLKIFDYEISAHKQSDYSALSNMYPRWWFPQFQFTEQRSEFGITTSGADALEMHNYSITASYDTKLNKPAGQLSYAYVDRLFLSAMTVNEIYLDANGDLDRISKHSTGSAVLSFPNRYIQSQSALLFSILYDITSDAELSAGAVPYDDFEDNLLGTAWLYNSANINPLSISKIDGMSLRLVAEGSDTLDSDYSGQVYTLDWRQYIRSGRESVFFVRFLQGWGTDQPRPFQLGGEGSNSDAVSVLLGAGEEAVFNARNYPLRGYEEGLPQLSGRRAQILTGEWRFPLQRIEKGIMAPPVGIMQWSGKVFAETGTAYQDSPDSYYSSAGIEVIGDINIFYGLTLRVHAGFAHGFDDDIGGDLVYLRVGGVY